MKNFYDVLKQYVSENHPNFGDGEKEAAFRIENMSARMESGKAPIRQIPV